MDSDKKYKVWVHLEEIPDDDLEDPKSLDNYFLPLPVAEFEEVYDAIKLMEHLHEQYFFL